MEKPSSYWFITFSCAYGLGSFAVKQCLYNISGVEVSDLNIASAHKFFETTFHLVVAVTDWKSITKQRYDEYLEWHEYVKKTYIKPACAVVPKNEKEGKVLPFILRPPGKPGDPPN